MGPAATAVAKAASACGRMPRLGADCLQVPIRHGGVPLVTERFVRAAHRARLPVQVWTVDDASTMRRLLELEVDAIMTNRPALAFETIRPA
jgi:glycerophosphoryl diester phosphodiesterase